MARIYFATSRIPDNADNPTKFLNEFSNFYDDLRFGYYDSSNSKDFTFYTYPDTDSKDEFGSTKLFRDLKDSMKSEKRDTILFVHGYNTSFEESLKLGAEIQENLKKTSGEKNYNPNLIVFSWPSQGNLVSLSPDGNLIKRDYEKDRKYAEIAKFGFSRAMLKLIKFLNELSFQDYCNQKIHLIAHSMGVYAFRHTFYEILKSFHFRPVQIFHEIIFIAGDEDTDTFSKDYKFQRLPEFASRVTSYFNKEDMVFSGRYVKIDSNRRLGKDGMDSNNIPKRIYEVDTTAVVDFPMWQQATDIGKFLEHTYFINTKQVLTDIYEVLIGVDTEKGSYRGRFVSAADKYRLEKNKK